MEDIKHHLRELLSEVSVFPKGDLLINLIDNKCVPYFDSVEINSKLQKILNEARKLEKKTGVACLCRSFGTYTTTLRNESIVIPIFLQHVEANIHKSSNTVQFSTHGEKELNPYLKKHFNDSSHGNEIRDLIEFQHRYGLTKASVNHEDSFIGNFDPKRFAFIRELNSLIKSEDLYSNALIEVYGNNSPLEFVIKEDIGSLFPMDNAQFKLFNAIKSKSLVVQGPPGTGKSQLLSNVIGTTLYHQKRSLIISEKQAAIDVILHKIKTSNLDTLCFKIPSKHANRDFVESLKRSWETIENNKPIIFKKCFEQLISSQKKYAILNRAARTEMVTIQEVLEILECSFKPLRKKNGNNVNFKTLNWLNEYNSKALSGFSNTIRHLKVKCFRNDFNHICEIIRTLKKNLPEGIETWNELKSLQKRSLSYQTLGSKLHQKYRACIKDQGTLFFKLQKEYKKNIAKVKQLEKEQQHWKVNPTRDELDILSSLFNKKYFFLFRLKRWLIWKRFTRTPQLDPKDQIRSYRKYIKAQEKIEVTENKLGLLGIENFDEEEAQVVNLLKTTNFTEAKEFEEKNQLDMHQNKLIYTSHYTIQEYFSFEDDDNILQFLSGFITNQEKLALNWAKIESIPSELLPFWNADKEIMSLEVKAHLKKKVIFNHKELSSLTKRTLQEELSNINNSFEENALIQSQNILNKWSEKFQEFDNITKAELNTLNTSQRTLRKKLKRGKAILTKEFAKKRSHKSIRELLLSDARIWIDILKPIWFGNPSLLADHLPMEKEMYDFVVSDESSQLLLSHSLGAVHRGVRTVICGDPEQMTPSSYFKKRQETEMSLLHHAYFHLPKVFLSNHYRSLHPSLIGFSNENFYDNRLLTFPSAIQERNPITHHFIENGAYIDRKNKKEAEAIAIQIAKIIRTPHKLGIVAFSEIQLELILSQLNENDTTLFETQINENNAFAHSLENVQGDECDILIISLGYGYNENGKFEMRFGPVNNFGGPKRLNVLFSRAKREIHFYSSVKAKDFSKTENQGVLHLKKWFEFMGENNKSSPKEKDITIDTIIDQSNGFHDLLTFTKVLSDRGYSVNQFS